MIGTYPVGSNPQGLAFDGANIWVPNLVSNTLTKPQASTGAVLATYSITGPTDVVYDGSHIWVVSIGANTVTR